MSSFAMIAIGIGLIPLAFILLTVISNPQFVRSLIDRFFLIILCIPELLRNGCSYVFNHIRSFFRNSAYSVGLSGENNIQRIIGAILLTFCTLVAIIVSVLILIITLEGIFNSGISRNSIANVLPIPVEILMGIELVAASILFGMLLLDLLGVTHLTKFYSPIYLSRYLRYIFGVIFVIGLIFSFYLLASGGYIRYASLLFNKEEASIDSTFQTDSSLYIPDQTINNVDNIKTDENKQNVNSENFAVNLDTYNTSIKTLMVGIPISSGLSGLFGAIGLIPFGSMLISGLSFIIVAVLLGPIWLISHALVVLINHIYNFVFNFLNIFIQIGEGLKWRSGNHVANNHHVNPSEPPKTNTPTTDEIQSDRAVETEQNTEDDNPNPHDTGEQNHDTLYSEDDPNWNPLTKR
jgi:hypothetical protein